MPPPLIVAASLTAVEGLVLLLLAVAELANLSSERLTMGATTAAFFAIFGGAALLVAWGLRRGRGWSRGPAVMFQLFGLLLAWSFRGLWPVALALLAVAAITLVGVLHPRSIETLTRDD